MKNHQKKRCQICQKEFPIGKLFPVRLIRNGVLDTLYHQHPDINRDGYICYSDLREIRADHVEHLLTEDRGALTNLDKQVLDSLASEEILAENVNKKFDQKLTFGERMADKVAQFGGSWKFIISFFSLLIIWMIINAFFLMDESFDPYPFILLNLILSCLAAIQAPIIMMSQNRQAAKDRLQANEEYATNLKAELEIQQLHNKLDLFMKKQWESLLELQKIQIELTEDLLHHRKGEHKKDTES
ncbi:MAG: DUF1003 domain-containing protein [Chlamydiia bacterium]|nr:DUF1003 domain-containing protein [Chlamydiia bacterium]